ncbi:hypothetical protein, partial [Burkholderia gladioli]|uniref:hypothetical protein n=1 Tax=Burkholderia gladioli TaxID=28095 RepID=UPI001ABB4273
LFQNPDDLAFRESGRLHAKFPVDPAARKFYLEHPLILGGTTGELDGGALGGGLKIARRAISLNTRLWRLN